MKGVFLIAALILIFGCGSPNKKAAENVTATPDSTANSNEIAYKDNSISINDNDTITINGYKLYFIECDSIKMPKLFKDQEVRDQLTDTINNSLQAAIAVEKYLQKEFKDYFIADDSVLTLFLENAQKIELKKWNKKEGYGNNFVNYFPKENYFLIYNQLYEGDYHTLVNRKNGFKRGIPGEPYFSPSGKKILAINMDLFAGFSTNGFELLTIQGDTLRADFEIDLTNEWGPSGVKWINDDELILEKTLFNANGPLTKRSLLE